MLLFVLPAVLSCGTRNAANNSAGLNDLDVLLLTPGIFISELPAELAESSGLLVFDNLFWTFNDSGGKSRLYAVNRKGEIVRTIDIANAPNHDWEDIAQDDASVYVGDFGNNNGTRKNLLIWKIDKDDLSESGQVTAEEISFIFAGQENFNYRPMQHAFDCEALIEFENQLHLFSKDWVDEKTTVYRLGTEAGSYHIDPKDTFNVGALITGADINPDRNMLALSGYHNFKPVVRLFSNFNEDDFFGGHNLFIGMDAIEGAQTEGIAFLGNDTLLISCEATSGYNQQIFYIDLKELNVNAEHTGY